MAFQLSGCQLPPRPLMTLKTINRKSIFLMVTDWSVGIIYHVRLEQQLLLTRDPHRTCRSTRRGNRNLTWLHRSGHWVLCGGGHWLGYTPVQSRCWCLRKGETAETAWEWQMWLFNSIHPPAQIRSSWQRKQLVVSWTTAEDAGSTPNPLLLWSHSESCVLLEKLL